MPWLSNQLTCVSSGYLVFSQNFKNIAKSGWKLCLICLSQGYFNLCLEAPELCNSECVVLPEITATDSSYVGKDTKGSSHCVAGMDMSARSFSTSTVCKYTLPSEGHDRSCSMSKVLSKTKIQPSTMLFCSLKLFWSPNELGANSFRFSRNQQPNNYMKNISNLRTQCLKVSIPRQDS